MVEKARQARVETQYYVTSDAPAIVSDALAKQVPRFLVKCSGIVDGLTEKEVQALRKTFTKLLEESRNRRYIP